MNLCPKVSSTISSPFKMNYSASCIATTEQIDKAKDVIKKLTFEFQSDSFENPGIAYKINTQNFLTWFPGFDW